MTKIPKTPQEIFPELTDDYRKTFGGDLVSLILYGSGAAGHYVAGKSDINVLVIVTEAGLERLDQAIPAVGKWRKRAVAVPLFMTRAFVLSSVDAYPIEFLNMKIRHGVIFGEDVLDAVSINPVHLRLQIERELKGKMLHLREGFLAAEGKAKKIRELIKVSFNAILALFHAILYLKERAVPEDKRQAIAALADVYPLNAEVFTQCAEIKEGTDAYASGDIETIFKNYLQEINRLSDFIDHEDKPSSII
jgi:hypothetical protein